MERCKDHPSVAWTMLQGVALASLSVAVVGAVSGDMPTAGGAVSRIAWCFLLTAPLGYLLLRNGARTLYFVAIGGSVGSPDTAEAVLTAYYSLGLPLIAALSLHEAAHGLAARLMGDRTATEAGRVTLDPAAHYCPTGLLLFPALLLASGVPVLLGWAKPIPVDPDRFRDRRMGMAVTAAAGPAANLLAALASLALLSIAPEWLRDPLKGFGAVNAVLFVFNLVPLPPMDGGRIVGSLLPPAWLPQTAKAELVGILLAAALFLGVPAATAWHTGEAVSPAALLVSPVLEAYEAASAP